MLAEPWSQRVALLNRWPLLLKIESSCTVVVDVEVASDGHGSASASAQLVMGKNKA